MFLHSGASLHGHEYSQKAPAPAPRRYPLLRSALLPVSDNIETQRPGDKNASPPLAPPLPANLRRARGLSNPSPLSQQCPASKPARPRPTSECFARREVSVRFREPEAEAELEEKAAEVASPDAVDGAVSDDDNDGSVDVSDCTDSDASAGRKRRRRREARKVTRFVLAHPAPRLRTKQRRLVQIRPRLLLQLQQIGEKRPMPAFDVLPSSLLAGPVTSRLARKFPRIFRKTELGVDDLIIARSEDYEAPSEEDDVSAGDDDAALDRREMVAVIRPVAGDKDTADIVLENGGEWRGRKEGKWFEFVSVDEAGNKKVARWVQRPVNVRPSSISSISNLSSPLSTIIQPPPEYRYTFSIIDPSSRRHPIMATLTSTHLEVHDHFTTISPSSALSPPTKPFDSAGSSRRNSATGPGRTTQAVDDQTRALITASATWISLRHQATWGVGASPSSSMGRATPPRAATSLATSPCAAAVAAAGGTARLQFRQERAATFPLAAEESRPASLVESERPLDLTGAVVSGGVGLGRLPAAALPRRHVSSGAAFMQRRRRTYLSELEASGEATTKGESSREGEGEVGDDEESRRKRIFGVLKGWKGRISARVRSGP